MHTSNIGWAGFIKSNAVWRPARQAFMYQLVALVGVDVWSGKGEGKTKKLLDDWCVCRPFRRKKTSSFFLPSIFGGEEGRKEKKLWGEEGRIVGLPADQQHCSLEAEEEEAEEEGEEVGKEKSSWGAGNAPHLSPWKGRNTFISKLFTKN